MKKYNILLFILITVSGLYGQNRKDAPNYVPNYFPPSPTVANLMRFEEIPVENYTGTPDVAIPIHTVSTGNNKVNLDVSLKYHPSSIAVNQLAGDVGLGWSLFAGGTISRTVKDIPDEALIYSKKVGIYQTTVAGSTNNYYNVRGILNHTGIQNPAQQYMVDEYLWEVNEKGKYDSEHDLWQFNFMGFTGRFYIKKNMATGMLEVVPLENYNIKIQNLYNTVNNYPSDVIYSPVGFIITDTNGLKYYFETAEQSKLIPFTYSEFYPNTSTFGVGQQNLVYKSAFHLTRILDSKDNLLVQFDYYSEFKEITTTNKGVKFNNPVFSPHPYWTSFENLAPSNTCPDGGSIAIEKLEPIHTISSTQNDVQVKKIKDILVTGQAKIHFNFEGQREDDNYINSSLACKLKEITVTDWNNQLIKKFELGYEYKTLANKRLFLKEVAVFNKGLNKEENYELSYEENSSDGYTVGMDSWGYYNLKPLYIISDTYREVSPQFCTTEVLQKMKLPSGGSIVFNYEPNSYTYENCEQKTNFDSNPDNWNYHEKLEAFTTLSNNKTTFFTVTDAHVAYYKIDIEYPSNENRVIDNWYFKLYKVVNGIDTDVATIWAENGITERVGELGNLTPGVYKISFGSPQFFTPTLHFNARITAFYKSKKPETLKYLYGGGIRIKTIGVFEKDVDKNYYKWVEYYSQYDLPSKEKNYQYRLKEDTTKGSGFLIFPLPVFNYSAAIQSCFDCGGYPGNRTLEYTTATTYNNLLANKTRGSDVGYKNVTVFEKDNGRIEYDYSTCLDFPEDNPEISYQPPFLPYESFDFKKGLLQNERIYDKSGRILTETNNAYDIESYAKEVGLKVFNYLNKRFTNSYKYASFDIFSTYKEICKNPANLNYNCNFGTPQTPLTPNPSLPSCPCRCYDGEEVPEIIRFIQTIENFGWVKLSSSLKKEYFYDGSTTRIVNNNQSFTYNPLNRRVYSETTTDSFGETIETRYFYPVDSAVSGEPNIAALLANNMIETPLVVEHFKNGAKLSTQKTEFAQDAATNNFVLPKYVYLKKGEDAQTTPLEKKITFNYYDDRGNITQYTLENGSSVTIIWGYNKAQPIAKIENATNAQVASVLGLSNLTTVTEANMPGINNLRIGLPGAMITTYTYIPQVGIHTITDPKGDIITYEYDNFNRLKAAYDKAGNKLSENVYHYRTQN